MIARSGASAVRMTAFLLIGAAFAAGPASRAQGPAGAGGSFVGCAEALNETLRSGMPSVIVITSRAADESIRLRDAIARDLLGSSIGRSALFAEMPVELYPDRVDRLGVRRFPTLIAYGRRDGALARLGRLDGPSDPARVAAWLGSIGLFGPSGASEDPGVDRAGLIHRDRGSLVAVPMHPPSPVPSPQQPSPPPPPVAKPQPQPQPMAGLPMQPAPQAMSTVISQEAGPPIVLQQQAPAIYIQPQAPRILLGQMPPPEITIVQAPQGAPTVNYAVLGPQQAAPNLFAVPQPQPPAPTYGMPSPQSPMAAMPEPPVAYAAPIPGAAALAPVPVAGLAATPQQSLVATTAIALLLENPDVLNALIGALGRGLSLVGSALEKHGHPRVRLPRPEPPPASSGTLALVPGAALPQVATVPVMTVPAQAIAPAPAQAPLYAAPAPPPAVIPSPQSAPPSHPWGHHGDREGFFSRWKK